MSVPFDPSGSVNERGGPENNESFTSYIPAGRAIRFLGARGERLRPLTKDREKEVFTEYSKLFGDEFAARAINLFKVMQMSINGEVNPYSSARNRSGLLYPPGQRVKDQSLQSSETKRFGSQPLLQSKKVLNTPLADNSKATNHTQIWVWLVGFLGVILMIFFVMLKIIRVKSSKSKS